MQQESSPSSRPVGAVGQRPSGKKKRRNVWFTIIIPLVLFVLTIGGIAWLAQNVPTWRKSAPPAPSKKPPLVFETKRHEIEEHVVGSSGRFDFTLTNTTNEIGTFGVYYISCQCSDVKIATFPKSEWGSAGGPTDEQLKKADWKALTQSNQDGIDMPANGKAILRINWHDREQLPKILNLVVRTWFRPSKTEDPLLTELNAPLRLVEPVRCLPQRVNLGVIDDRGEAVNHFWCWSPFFDELDLEIVEENPHFQYTVTKLSKAKRKQLEKLLEDRKDSTTVRAAMRIEVQVFAQKGGKQLDLGPFVRQVILKAHGKKYDNVGPLLTGRVQGPLTVGRREDKGRIHLPKFFPDVGVTHTVRIRAHEPMKLSVAKTVPGTLIDAKENVKLEEVKSSTENAPAWSLTITIPKNKASFGHLPEDCAVYLQTDSTPPRTIRIPIEGYAKRP